MPFIIKNSGYIDREAGENRINECMSHASYWFLQFKWWTATGVDAAVWICHKHFHNPTDRTNLVNAIRNQTNTDWSNWMLKLLNLGTPAIFDQIQSGHDNIWVTDVTIENSQRLGVFPEIFQNETRSRVAGIIIKKVADADRPGQHPNDLVLDVIITVHPKDEEAPGPVLHRQQIPHWTREQIATFGRYTTGPLVTHWTKI